MTPVLRLIKPQNFVTTKWSGGLTRQLAIGPSEAVYAHRDFLWRVSSATVELAQSDFTPLPDYNRYLSTIVGTIYLKHGDGVEFTLTPGQVDYFDGGVATVSKGICTDFNLMLRKDKCQGVMLSFALDRCSGMSLPVLQGTEKKTLVLFCTKGKGTLMDTGVEQEVAEGEALLFENLQLPIVQCTEGFAFMLAEIISK